MEATVIGALGRFADQVTRVEVHLSDENGAKGGAADKRCMLEARLEGRTPTAVTHKADTVEEAMDGAAEKLARSIDSTRARMREYRPAATRTARSPWRSGSKTTRTKAH